MEDGLDDSPIEPTISFLGGQDETVNVEFYEFAEQKTALRGVPAIPVGSALPMKCSG